MHVQVCDMRILGFSPFFRHWGSTTMTMIPGDVTTYIIDTVMSQINFLRSSLIICYISDNTVE